MKPIIAISMGDPSGIGPEIILKTLSELKNGTSTPVIFGDEFVFRYYAKTLGLTVDLNIIYDASDSIPGEINLINCTDSGNELNPGSLNAESGRAAMKAISAGIDECITGKADALVTAPISKEAISLAGYKVPGHTEFLAVKTGTKNVLMMLVCGGFRVALATIHIPLKRVADQITPQLLKTRLISLQKSLKEDFLIENPRIAVLGLNPHAGDGGVMGREEIDIISPVIEKLSSTGMDLSGPFAADGFFGNRQHSTYDAVFAMYHDQGLIPFKALTFGKGVNFTAGLPIVRTSPDHGTAFDIAGKNLAENSSFTAAYTLAEILAQNRKQALLKNN